MQDVFKFAGFFLQLHFLLFTLVHQGNLLRTRLFRLKLEKIVYKGVLSLQYKHTKPEKLLAVISGHPGITRPHKDAAGKLQTRQKFKGKEAEVGQAILFIVENEMSKSLQIG